MVGSARIFSGYHHNAAISIAEEYLEYRQKQLSSTLISFALPLLLLLQRPGVLFVTGIGEAEVTSDS